MQLMFDADKISEAVRSSAPNDVPDYMLVRLLRLIFYAARITLDDFSARYASYGKQLNWNPEDIRIRHNNDRKALAFSNKLTIFLFNRILLNVMRTDIEGFEITVRDTVTGERTTYSSSDPVN
jgi:hypothetical protein